MKHETVRATAFAMPRTNPAFPFAELPVLQVLSAKHVVADLTLGLGTVVLNYLSPSRAARRRETDSEILIEANAG